MNQTTEPELEELSVSELVRDALVIVDGVKRDITRSIAKVWLYRGLTPLKAVLKELQTRTG